MLLAALRDDFRVTPDLEAEVRSTFGARADAAIEALGTYDAGRGDDGANRVRRAIVALSNGDLGRLRHFTDQERRDYRDVLYWAENQPDAGEPRSYTELRERLGLPRDPEHEGE